MLNQSRGSHIHDPDNDDTCDDDEDNMISENDPKPFLTDWKQPEHGFTALGFSSNRWRSFRVSREILQEKHLNFYGVSYFGGPASEFPAK